MTSISHEGLDLNNPICYNFGLKQTKSFEKNKILAAVVRPTRVTFYL